MRGTLDHLRFEVVRYERNAADNAESKVYLSKKLLPEMISTHRSSEDRRPEPGLTVAEACPPKPHGPKALQPSCRRPNPR